MKANWQLMFLAGLALAISTKSSLASTTSANLGYTGLQATFGEMSEGEVAIATVGDFCMFGQNHHLKMDVLISENLAPKDDTEVWVVKAKNGVYVSVHLPDGITETMQALSKVMDFVVSVATGSACKDPIRTLPVISTGAEGLSVVREKDIAVDFQFDPN